MRCFMIVAILIVGIAGLAYGVGMKCTQDGQCGDNECCQRLRKHPIASKRAVNPRSKTGICMPYRKLGDKCKRYEKANGACGCGPETACTTFTVPIKKETDSTIFKRGIVAPPKGFTYEMKCTETKLG